MLEGYYDTSCAISVIPFFHSFGFMTMFLNLLRGRKFVFLKKFNARVFLDAVVHYKVKRKELLTTEIKTLIAGENDSSSSSRDSFPASSSIGATVRSFARRGNYLRCGSDEQGIRSRGKEKVYGRDACRTSVRHDGNHAFRHDKSV